MAGKNKNSSATPISGGKAKGINTKARSSSANRSPNGNAALPVLNPDKLRELYSIMLKCRMLNDKLQVLLPATGLHEPIAMIGGREAMLVGAIAHLVPEDAIALAHGGCAASYIRGTPLNSVVAQLLASQTSVAGRELSDGKRRASPAQLAMATGMKLADDLKEKARVALIFPGADEAAMALIHNGLALTAKSKLPLVCLVESTLSSKSGMEVEGSVDYSPARTPEYHYPQIIVDGTDVVGVFRVVQEAVRRARSGHGPSLIKCVMPERNAGPEGLQDPLVFMEQYLRRRELWSDEWRRKLVDNFNTNVEAAVASAGKPPDSEVPFDHVYSSDWAGIHLGLAASVPS